MKKKKNFIKDIPTRYGTEFDEGIGFENTDNDVIYWMEMPKYNGELDD